MRADEPTRVSQPVPVEHAAKTDPGRDPDKQVNEDHHRVGQTRLGFLAIVCDGMGGHAGGKEASALAARTVFEEVEGAAEGQSAGAALRHAVEVANRKVYALGQEGMHGRPGSTIVALLFHEGGAEIAHVGDSRIYLLRGVECVQLTRDHSAVQIMVDAGILTPEQAKVHPEANKITRALGIEAEVEVDLRAQPFGFAPGDTFLLCSDGLSDLAETDDLLRLIGGVPLAQAAGQLVDLANARGGHDNITALLVRTKSAALTQTEPRTQLMPAAPQGQSGVAKTVLGAPIAAPMAAPAAPLEPRVSPTMLMGGPNNGPEPHPRAFPPQQQHPSRSMRAPLLVGLALALVVLAVLGTVLYFELRERGGRHHETPDGIPLPTTTTVPTDDDLFAPIEPERTAPHAEEGDDGEAGLQEELAPAESQRRRRDPSAAPSSSTPSPRMAPSPSPSPAPNPKPIPTFPDPPGD